MTRHNSPSDEQGSPFLQGLKRYGERRIIRFHTPGHRGGRWLDPSFLDAVGPGVASLDVSDLLEGEEGPTDWTETIRRVEERAAKVFGAAATRFLVNGTSGGIHAALLAVGTGKRALFSRASHLSVYAATILAGHELHYLPSSYDAEWDIPGPPSRESVLSALERVRPDVVVDTYPNYYGLAHDLRALCAPPGGAPAPLVVVDEAHGSHFAVCPGAPPPALSLGAALTVQSFHKTLGALTQSSVLHVAEGARELVPLIDRSLFLLQTTSPSPILLASLEAAVRQLERSAEIEEAWRRAARIAAALRAAIDQGTDCRCLDASYARAKWGASLDPVRVVVNAADAGWTGIGAARWLRVEKRIQVEMANQTSFVVLISPGNDESDAEHLVRALRELSHTRPPEAPAPVASPPSPRPQMSPREALSRPVEWVPLGRSVGRIAAEIVCPYPPGVPVLVPGEMITGEIVEYLGHVRRVGWEVRGAAMWHAGKIAVVK